MEELFHKIPVKLPNKPSPKEKRKSLLHSIGGGWYVEKLVQKLAPLKKSKLSKKRQEKEDIFFLKTTIELHIALVTQN